MLSLSRGIQTIDFANDFYEYINTIFRHIFNSPVIKNNIATRNDYKSFRCYFLFVSADVCKLQNISVNRIMSGKLKLFILCECHTSVTANR